ncbi:MAG: type II secretion system F family protein [Candidatus Omnitrophota bacterium]
MKKFFYRAKSGPDDVIEGVITASTEQEAVASLSRKGYVATSLQEFRKEGREGASLGNASSRRGTVGKKELISFTRQLSVLVRSGIPLVRGLDILSSQIKNMYLGKVVDDISKRIKNGETLSSGMSAYPKVFSDFYRAMVSAGEESGTVDKSLERLSEYYQTQARIMAKVRAAMAYPLFIAIVGILTVVFVFTNVMPRIIPVLLSLNTELPLPTRALIFMSEFFKEKWGVLALGLFIFALMFRKAMGSKTFKGHISSLKLKLPVFGDLILKSELSRFTRAMEICMGSGIPAIGATSISLSMIGEYHLRQKLEGSIKSIERGRSLTETFSEAGIFPVFAINLINVGEESGNVTESMKDISDAFEADCGDAVDVALGLLEPAMVLVVGLIVGFIVSAVLLPVFQMNFVQM